MQRFSQRGGSIAWLPKKSCKGDTKSGNSLFIPFWKITKTLTWNHCYSSELSSFLLLLFIARGLDWLHWLKAGWSLWYVVWILWWHQWVRYHFLSPALEVLLWSSRIPDCNKRRWQDWVPLGLLQVNIYKQNGPEYIIKICISRHKY